LQSIINEENSYVSFSAVSILILVGICSLIVFLSLANFALFLPHKALSSAIVLLMVALIVYFVPIAKFNLFYIVLLFLPISVFALSNFNILQIIN